MAARGVWILTLVVAVIVSVLVGYQAALSRLGSYPANTPVHGETSTTLTTSVTATGGVTAPSVNVTAVNTSSLLELWSKLLEAYQTSWKEQGYPSGYYPAYPTPITVPTATPIVVVERSGTASTVTQVPSYTPTNVQVPGVDEPDVVKVNGTHLVVAHRGFVWVYRVYPIENAGLITRVNLSNIIAELAGDEYLALVSGNETRIVARVERSVTVKGLFFCNGTVAIIATEYRWPGPLEPRTWVIGFDSGLTVDGYVVLPGAFYDARMVNGTVIVVTYTAPRIPVIVGPRLRVIPYPIPVGGERAETLVTAVRLEDWKVDSKALLGVSPSALYVSADGSVYVVSSKWLWFRPLAGVKGPLTTIVRVEVEPLLPRVSVESNTTIPGRIWKQWMLDVYKGVLRVVVEDWVKGKLLVSVYTFDAETLEMLGSLENITVNERVRGVRFIGPRLYLVTYRYVDPLFTIDLTDPRKPRVLGYLKGPGFDEYLHPINGSILLGVGVESGSVRLSLYRVNSDGSIDVLQRLYVEGYTWTPVLSRWGHKAFTYDKARGEVMIPVWSWLKTADKAVAVVRVDASKGVLELRGLLRHPMVLRQVVIDDVVYTVAPDNPIEMVKAFNATSLKELGSWPGPVKTTVAEIKGNRSYIGMGVEIKGIVINRTRIGWVSGWLVDDGTGTILVSEYSPYLRRVWLEPGSRVAIVGVVMRFGPDKVYLQPYEVRMIG